MCRVYCIVLNSTAAKQSESGRERANAAESGCAHESSNGRRRARFDMPGSSSAAFLQLTCCVSTLHFLVLSLSLSLSLATLTLSNSRAVVFARSLACFRCAHEVKTIENTRTRLQLLVYLSECCLCCLHMVYRRRSHSQSDSLHRPRRGWGGLFGIEARRGCQVRERWQSKSEPA